jgi:hypothetical protein
MADQDHDAGIAGEFDLYQTQLTVCMAAGVPCGWREHVVGISPNGNEIIDAVCPYCGSRVASREVVDNQAGERYEDFRF